MNKKIALFGGSFDPIHTDHINIIKSCKEKLKFDEVWVIPAFVNPFKQISTSSVSQRIEMIKMATANLDYVVINEYEISKEEKSYTYNTVEQFTKNYPDYKFSFIMGSDQLDNLEKWNYFGELIKLVDFKVFLRSNNYNKNIIKKYNIQTFEFDNNYLSSTQIRSVQNLNLQIPKVNNYINNNLMYLHERLELHMDEQRYYHSLNVGQMCVELAELNNYNIAKARIAGTVHDIAKRWSDEKMNEYIKKYDPSLIKEPFPVLHSYVGAFHLKYDWLLDDEEIIQAVFNHTAGRPNMSILDMIVFCADKISYERTYDKIEEYRKLVKSDLKTGFLVLLKNQYDVAIDKHSIDNIGDRLLKTCNFYLKGDK